MFGYPDMAPPSYSAVVGQKGVNIAGEDDKHTYGDMSYHPVYTFAQPYQGSYQPPPEQYPPQVEEKKEYPPEYQQQPPLPYPPQSENMAAGQQQMYPPPAAPP